MFQIVLLTAIVAAMTGLIIKFCLDRYADEKNITWKEFAIGMAIIVIMLAPGVTKLGWELAKDSQVQYNEYWNGWELQADRDDIVCTRDGPCSHEYDCDPYTVLVSYSCNCDSKGHCDTCYRTETHYHSCPYVDMETTYTITTTLDSYTIASHRFPDNPQAHRWRKSVGVPDGVISHAGVGIPPFWAAAKARIDAGSPGPASARRTYVNYILASDHTILKQYSAEIDRFNKAGLLPRLNSGIHDFYLTNKVYFVGFRPNNAIVWQKELGHLNAALGTELQGDVHLVIVENSAISNNPDAYVLALKAYWQNTQVFGRDALSKNGIGVVIGTTDGQTVAWSRAFTGMPLGNEEMTVALRGNLKGRPLEPGAVIGQVRGKFSSAAGRAQVYGLHEKGALERTIWGLDEPQTKFRRYSMSGKGANKIGAGFLYLKGEIQPTLSQKIWIGVFVFLASGLVWLACALIGDKVPNRGRRYY